MRDPGNVGTVIRSAHAFADGPVVLGPDCADPFSPKAVRASMGSVFARPPARAKLQELSATTVGLDAHEGVPLDELDAEVPLVLCLGVEREAGPTRVDSRARIPMRADGAESLNVAMAATIALYVARNRMARHA